MDEKFNTLLSISIIPEVVDLIVKNEGIDDIFAINEFYNSQTYLLLSKEETKFWHYSPLTLFLIWKNEKDTGNILFPEECA